MAPERIKVEPKLIGGEPLVVTNRMSEIVVSGGFRIFLANRLIALGWALKGCKPCAHGLFSTARWLVPEARRFLVRRTGPHTRNRLLFSRQTPHKEDKGMKRPLSQAAFDTYVANPECAAYLASDILEKRLHQLLRLIADGEKFTVCEAADFVFLPSEVFRFVWAEVLATEHESTM